MPVRYRDVPGLSGYRAGTDGSIWSINIKIVVVEIRGDKVCLGIEAPKQVPVHRTEVENAINEANAAKEAAPGDEETNVPLSP